MFFVVKAGLDEYLLAHVVAPHPLDRASRALVARVGVDMVHVPTIIFHLAVLGFFTSNVCVGGGGGALVVGGGGGGAPPASASAEESVEPPPSDCAGVSEMRGSIAQCVALAACTAASLGVAVVDWRRAVRSA